MAKLDHIFIVGLGRTGSTLTRQILNSSEAIGLGSESHFFRDLPRFLVRRRPSFREQIARVGDIRTDSGAAKVVDFIFSITDRHYYFWNLRARNVDRDEFLSRLLATDRSERALFELAMACHAGDKPIRGEKTPAHLFFVPTLLEWFPNAKVIHTFRDPRAIYASSRTKAAKKRYGPATTLFRQLGLIFELYSSLQVIVPWIQAIRLHHRYCARYPDRYYLSRYEDLVCDPEGSLRRLCAFLEVEFTPEMLRQSVVNSSYAPTGQVQGFDATAIDRWREHLDPLLQRWFLLWCREPLLRFGYAP
ncbi:MAG TPA: sulfotransferase [Roseiflexaceae bacterium]|nr:sulfotransferase [Roseiflexaceae bacterium]